MCGIYHIDFIAKYPDFSTRNKFIGDSRMCLGLQKGNFPHAIYNRSSMLHLQLILS